MQTANAPNKTAGADAARALCRRPARCLASSARWPGRCCTGRTAAADVSFMSWINLDVQIRFLRDTSPEPMDRIFMSTQNARRKKAVLVNQTIWTGSLELYFALAGPFYALIVAESRCSDSPGPTVTFRTAFAP